MTTEPSLPVLLDRLASLVTVNPAATDQAIDAVERRLRIRMTSDFREVYLRLNGTADGTPLENGWFQLWSLARWYSVDEYVQHWPAADRNKFKDIGAAIVFADYSIESWHYAVHFSRDSTMSTSPIYLLHLQPYFVATSLRGFLAAALVDGSEVYPPGMLA